MMTFAFGNSSMNTEVVPQPQPRGTESWTVGALGVSCCDHSRGCSVVSLSGSSEFLASSLFEVGSSSVNRASPFWSVHGISLHVSRIDVAPLEISFDLVFIPQFWSTLVSFAGLEFSIHQASQHPTLLHSNHVSNPSKLGLDDDGLYAGGPPDWWCGPATWFPGWSGELACGRAPVSWYACDTVSTYHNHWGGREEPRHCRPSVS